MFITKSVDELLFAGYIDPIMEIGTQANEKEDYDEFNFMEDSQEYEEEYESREDNPITKMDKFGWFYKASIFKLIIGIHTLLIKNPSSFLFYCKKFTFSEIKCLKDGLWLSLLTTIMLNYILKIVLSAKWIILV